MAPKLKMAFWGVLVAFALTLAVPGIERSASAASLDKKSAADAKKATQLYKQGHYDDAAAIFLQLSVDNPGMPVFVRNLGACYYYLRRPEPALSNLREYLHKKKDIDADDRAEVESWIAEMDQLRRTGSATGASPGGAVEPGKPSQVTPGPADVPAPPPGPPVPGPAAPGPAATVAQTTPPLESDQGSYRRMAVWALGGVGGVGLVLGGVFAYLASSDYSDVEKKYDPGKQSQGKKYVTAEVVSFCVGGAAIAAGAVLYLTGRSASRSVVVAPTVGPGLAGAALSGTF